MESPSLNADTERLANLSEQDLVDYLCTAVEEEDVLFVWLWLKRLEGRGQKSGARRKYSWQDRSPLSTVCAAPQTPLRLFILQLLLLTVDDEFFSSVLRGLDAQPWAVQVVRVFQERGASASPTAAELLSLTDEAAAADWVDTHLPPPPKSPDELTGFKPLPPPVTRPAPPSPPAADAKPPPNGLVVPYLPSPLSPPVSRSHPPLPQGWSPPPPLFSPPSPTISLVDPSSPAPQRAIKPHPSLPPKPASEPPCYSSVQVPLTRRRKVLFPSDHPINLHLFPLPHTETPTSLTARLASLTPPLTGATNVRLHPVATAGSAQPTQLRPLSLGAFLTLPSRGAADALTIAVLNGELAPSPSSSSSPSPSCLVVERQTVHIPPAERWRFPLVTVEHLESAPQGERLPDLVRSTGVGAADLRVVAVLPPPPLEHPSAAASSPTSSSSSSRAVAARLCSSAAASTAAFRAGAGGGTFRVSSPDAAQRAVELLDGLEQAGGRRVRARWAMDEGVEWEVVEGLGEGRG
ncbi:hypothetical protein JCM6882_000631 [Rhodosporidiobolus microsporus]